MPKNCPTMDHHAARAIFAGLHRSIVCICMRVYVYACVYVDTFMCYRKALYMNEERMAASIHETFLWCRGIVRVDARNTSFFIVACDCMVYVRQECAHTYRSNAVR